MRFLLVLCALFTAQVAFSASPPAKKAEPDAAWQMRVELMDRQKNKNFSTAEEEYCLNEKIKFLSYAWQATKSQSKEGLNKTFDKLVPQCAGKVK